MKVVLQSSKIQNQSNDWSKIKIKAIIGLKCILYVILYLSTDHYLVRKDLPCGSTALMGPSSTGGPMPYLFLAMTLNM